MTVYDPAIAYTVSFHSPKYKGKDMTPLCFDVLLSNWELYPKISDGERDKHSEVNNLSLHPHFLSRQLSVVLHSDIASDTCGIY